MYASYTRLHIDLDSFFLSVELLKRPDLRGRTCAVGGAPGTRSVILSASYEARAFGVRAGIAVEHAVRLCPGLVLLPPSHGLYGDMSRRVMGSLSRWSPDHVVESVDEMSMDVSRVLSLRGSSLTIAKGIMSSIPAEFGITCSIGVAPNRLLAKFASDLRKPSGLTVLGPSCFVRITETMPVKKLHGVGPKTSASLEAMGLDTIGRLRQVDRNILSAKFGKTGEFLWMSCRGIDPSGPDDDASGGGREKSIGKETTLAQDTADKSSLLPVLMELVEDVCTRLRRERLGARTVQLKVKYYDFRLVTRRTTLDEPTDLEERVYAAVKSLFERIDSRPIRLVGVALSSLAAEAGSDAQPLLFQEKEDAEKTKMKKIAAVTDRLKDRFGTDIVRRASTLPRNREEKPD